jgi:predicted Zn-dependent protease
MRAELERSMGGLRMEGQPQPYYIGYQLKELQAKGISAREGAVSRRDVSHNRVLRVDVRVGDYALDNSEDQDGPGYEELMNYQPAADAPVDDDPHALRHALWLLTDRRYKEALTAYHRVLGREAFTMQKSGKTSFTKEPPAKHRDPEAPTSFDMARWEGEARRASHRLGGEAALFDSSVEVEMRSDKQVLITSEGTEVITERTIYGIHVRAFTRADDGMLLEHSFDTYTRDEAKLPSGAELDQAVDSVVRDLLALRAAEVFEPYTGPAILEPRAAGVIFHEAVGHRLEGDRQDDDEDGRTFAGQLGRPVLPTFITVVDDPTLAGHGTVALNGAYSHDDEGVPGQRTTLVEAGVLRGYLMRRKPVEGFLRSNGHGRAQSNAEPMARMGNIVVTASKTVSRDKLKKLLVQEAKRQGKPFGLIIGDIAGGSTNTSSYGYQAFKGAARMVYKVDAETGKETLVRGVEVVGTPLASINKITAASEETDVFNGYCGAESGYVPVSTVAPAMLFSEIELQRSANTSQRGEALPPPPGGKHGH